MRKVDVQFALNLLLNLLNPSHRSGGGGSGSTYGKELKPSSAAAAAAAAVQYNPAGDVRGKSSLHRWRSHS